LFVSADKQVNTAGFMAQTILYHPGRSIYVGFAARAAQLYKQAILTSRNAFYLCIKYLPSSPSPPLSSSIMYLDALFPEQAESGPNINAPAALQGRMCLNQLRDQCNGSRENLPLKRVY
jgi:hypothetical protein